jgi:chromatin segregation and condensation protein Rec8/ScpA/Scc1 (kleisin family)
MEFVSRAVREHGTIDFAELCRGFDRGGIIATFLAILELIRQRRLDFVQESPAESLRLLPLEPIGIHAN